MDRKKYIAIIMMLICCLVFAGCGSSENQQSADGYDFSYSDRDLDPSYDEGDAEKITLDGSDVSITEEGTYILSGSISDGQLKIETADDVKVQVVFDGVDITCSDDAPVYIKESDKVFITLADGSSNKLTGPETYSDAATEEGIDGVIYSKADLCINGSGSLTVSSSAHGIVSKDDLIITGGTFDITALGDGLQGKDCVKINAGNITINADNDGIRSSNTEDQYRGFVSVDGGTFNITAGYDGLQGATVVRVAGGTFDIETGGGSANASTSSSWGDSWGGGAGGGMMHGEPGSVDPGAQRAEGTESSDSSSDEDDISAKGIKGGEGIMILGGDINIDSSDDAVHSNGYANIEKGTLTISSGDDGVHADSDLKITGGTTTISKSYEGLEGNTITVDAGDIDITASDDGLNAAGGSDGSSTDDRAGANNFDTEEDAVIEINGGDMLIHANGDGIDSNGYLDITGGTMTVSCPTTGDTAVLDYGIEGNISGGTFIGTGAVQMAQTFSSSEQGVLAINAGNQSSGTEIVIKDSSGKEVVSYTPDQTFAVVIISTPDIVSGETYTINIGTVSGDITAS